MSGSSVDSPMGVVNWKTYGCVLLPLAGHRSLHCRSGMVRLPMTVASKLSLSKYSSRTIPSMVVLCRTNHRRCHFCTKRVILWREQSFLVVHGDALLTLTNPLTGSLWR